MASIGKDEDLRSFDVPEIARHPGGYTIYKIIMQITPKEFTENSYQLIYWKRYNDIRKLYDTLNRYHQAIYRPGKLPSFPNKSGYSDRFNPAIIEERRVATKEFLNFILQHLYLYTHDAYVKFFEKGEKVYLPEVQTDTLKPESIVLQQPEISIPILPSVPVETIPVIDNSDELLLNLDDDKESTEQINKILEDLNDLKFEDNIPTELEEDLISTPANTNINNSP